MEDERNKSEGILQKNVVHGSTLVWITCMAKHDIVMWASWWCVASDAQFTCVNIYWFMLDVVGLKGILYHNTGQH